MNEKKCMVVFFGNGGRTNLVFFHSQKEKPSILILLLDDAGCADFGFMGSTDIQTPNLDGWQPKNVSLRMRMWL